MTDKQNKRKPFPHEPQTSPQSETETNVYETQNPSPGFCGTLKVPTTNLKTTCNDTKPLGNIPISYFVCAMCDNLRV